MPARPPEIRIALYTRSATGSGALDAQEARLEAAVAGMGSEHAVTRSFRDAATSGLTLDRLGLRDLLAAAAAREIDVVMVTSHDRLSRSHRDLAHLRYVLAADGVRVSTPDEECEPAFAALIQQFSALAAT